MTYFEFYLYFNAPVLMLLGWLARKRLRPVHFRWMGGVLLIVLAFTFPWDNWAVGQGIWQFPEERVTVRVDHLPVEEILFFVIETIAVCLLAVLFLPKRNGGDPSQ